MLENLLKLFLSWSQSAYLSSTLEPHFNVAHKSIEDSVTITLHELYPGSTAMKELMQFFLQGYPTGVDVLAVLLGDCWVFYFTMQAG